ncbi:hexose transporter protein [Cadophora sp. MPI-SDFR-AT-0126]|nr:hexose transporter protein [Leotiomycetes sp. MPI-SDFR-AT-0126]
MIKDSSHVAITSNSSILTLDTTLLKLNTLMLCALLTQIASGYDSSMLNSMQALPQWQAYFGKLTGTRLGAMTFGPTGSILISVLISSQLCEKFGRRYPICGGSLIIILGSILQTAAINYSMFVVSRFFVGFGLGIVATAALPLLSESLGSLIAAWVTYGTFRITDSSWSWRIPSEALDIPTKYHADGDTNSRLVRFEIAEITATLEVEKMQKLSRWSEWVATKGIFLTAIFFATLADRAERNFKDYSLASADLVMIFLFSLCYYMCSPVAPTYIMEVVPYSLRAKASMLYQLTGNLAGLYNSFANPVAMDAIAWRYYIVWCVVIGINFTLIYFFFPETKGKGLEEVAEIFDGPNSLSGC